MGIMMVDKDERILVFPVDRESLPLIRSADNYSSVFINHLVSPKSWGHEGEFFCNNNRDIIVSHDYENAMEDCTTVWIVDSWNELEFTQFILPVFLSASEKRKKIVCFRCLSIEEEAVLKDLDVCYVTRSTPTITLTPESRVQEIRTPVVYVLSSTENNNQLYIETALSDELRGREYKTLLVSSSKACVVFGDHSIPDFIFCNRYSENEKVLAMNQVIRCLEATHQPDIFVIGIPGAALPNDYRYSTDFGILAYELSEAVRPDFAVLSSPCMLYDTDFFKGIEESLLGRLGVSIDIHSLSPYALDYAGITNEKRIGYLSLDDAYVQNTINQIAYNTLLNLNRRDGISLAVDRLINKLSGGAGALIT
jgi:peptide maturation system protein (TIGR04066 family)